MVSFPEALDLLMAHTPLMAVERCRLENASGRVLREIVVADRPIPAFDRVMMDGYALRFADWQAGHRTFRVTGSAPAGRAASALTAEAATSVEVMTGAPCPAGADCIVPVEEVIESAAASVKFSESADPVAGRFIHRAGSDAAAGEILLESGSLLGSREIGVAASCGAAWLDVSCIPKIAVIATGDELVAVAEIPADHQIRQSNGHSLAAALHGAGYPPREVAVLNDEVSTAKPALEKLLAAHDWLVLTGAVSAGARDFVPSLLAGLGCRKIFHGVASSTSAETSMWSISVAIVTAPHPMQTIQGRSTV